MRRLFSEESWNCPEWLHIITDAFYTCVKILFLENCGCHIAEFEMFRTQQVGPSDNTFDLNLGSVQIESQARTPTILTEVVIVFFGLSREILR
jgi:hypothetical protein